MPFKYNFSVAIYSNANLIFAHKEKNDRMQRSYFTLIQNTEEYHLLNAHKTIGKLATYKSNVLSQKIIIS